MRIGFLLLRDTFLKTMGSLIEESLARGYSVLLFFDETAASGSKAHQRMTADKLQSLLSLGAEAFPVHLQNLGGLGKNFEVHALVTHEGYHNLHKHLKQLTELRASGTKVVSLAHFYEVALTPLEGLESFDKTYYLSMYARDIHFGLWTKPETEALLAERYADRIEITGSPMLDQMRNLSREKICAELGIPADKNIVVLFAPVISAETPWRFYVWKEKNKLKRIWRIVKAGQWKYLVEAFWETSFEEIAQAIRRFCDQNHAFLIVKSRQKQQDVDYLVEAADLYISGDHEIYFPLFTSYKILSVADLSIAAMSMSVIESVAAGVPALNISVPHLDIDVLSDSSRAIQRNYMDAVTNVETTGPFNFPGCVTVIDRNQIVDWLDGRKLDDLAADKDALLIYQKKYLGISSASSSGRILDSIERLVGK